MLPSLSPDDPVATGRFLLIWVFIASLFNAVLAVVWNGWMHDLVPGRLRGRYFGQRNRFIQGATLVFVLGAGCGLSWGGYSARTFQVIMGLSLLSYAINLFIFSVGSLAIDKEPIVKPGLAPDLINYSDPLPQSLVLTAIVIGFALMCFALVLVMQLVRRVGTDDALALRLAEPPATDPVKPPLSTDGGTRA